MAPGACLKCDCRRHRRSEWKGSLCIPGTICECGHTASVHLRQAAPKRDCEYKRSAILSKKQLQRLFRWKVDDWLPPTVKGAKLTDTTFVIFKSISSTNI